METTKTPILYATLEIPTDSIIVRDRLRVDFGDIDSLATDIQENGLIQPIVVTSDHRLIAGERRLRAHRKLGLPTIKVVYLEVLDEAHLTILEASENIHRHNFSWQEKVLAIDKVHRTKRTESALRAESWGVRETGRLLRTAKSSINRATFLATYIRAGDPDILKAETMEDAYRVLLKRREDELSKQLVAQSATGLAPGVGPKVSPGTNVPLVRKEVSDDEFFADLDRAAGTTGFTPSIGSPVDLDERPAGDPTPSGAEAVHSVTIPLSQMFVNADAVAYTKTLPAETFDAVITDWPYGIEMSNIQQDGGGKDVSATAAEHDVRENKLLQAQIIPELFRVLKPNGWFITWTDMDVFQENKCALLTAGFKVQRWPLVWLKTSTCQNMSAQYNFTKNYEIAIVARKGNATLLRPQASSVWQGGADAETRLLGHPFAKPAALWEWLYNATCLRGASVYDPFVGSGSSTLPAIRLGLRPHGCEVNATHFGTLNVNLQNFYKSLDPKVQFA